MAGVTMAQSRFSRNLATIAVVAVAYFIAGKLGLRLAFAHPSATPVWPPTGIALAALLVLGRGVWPAILLGAFLVNITTAGTIATSAGIAAGNTLEGLLGAYLIERFAGGCRAFDRVNSVLKFAILGGLVCTTVSATWGVTSLALGGFARWSQYGSVWLTWWLGDAVGALFVTPLIIAWSVTTSLRWNRWRAIEGALLLISIVLVGEVLFGHWFPLQGHYFPVSFLCIPLVVWAACRFGQRETLTAVFILSALAIWGTLNAVGPFVRDTPNASLLLLQSFIAILGLTGIILSAAITERQQAVEAAHASELRYRQLFEQNVAGVFRGTLDGRVLECNEALARIFGYSSAAEFKDLDTIDIYFSAEEQAAAVAELREKKILTNYELRLRRKDGSPVWVLLNSTLVEQRKGEPPVIATTAIDVSDRKQAEEALQRAHDELELQVQLRTEQLSRTVDTLRAEVSERERAEAALRLLSGRLLKLQDEERRRIARELHDSTGQKAAALGMDLSVLECEAGALSARARRALCECSNLAEQLAREVRTLSYLLHPPLLDEVGLGSAIRWYADGVAQRGGLEIELQVPDKLRRMPGEVETALFRIVQESLTNTLLHSGSKKARILITQDDGRVTLEVLDEGKGMPPEVLHHPERSMEGLGVGIAGMRERVRQLGGRLEVLSGSRGTVVKASVPVGGAS